MQLELRHWLAILTTYVLLVNHWARDCIGALEIPLESNATGYGLTPRQYNSLSSIYFLPNALVPIIAGVISQRNGAAAPRSVPARRATRSLLPGVEAQVSWCDRAITRIVSVGLRTNPMNYQHLR